MNKRILSVRTVLLPFLLHTALVIIAYFGADHLPIHYPAGFINPALETSSLSLIDKLIRWDAHWYTYIADYGYNAQSIVFFPVIVVLIKAISRLGDINSAIAGLIVCNIFALLSFWAMAAVFRSDMPEDKTIQALLAYAVMPTSFFLNSIYTEPLFLTFSLACIYFVRQKKWHIAGISAALATLTRNIGITLILLLLLEYWQSANKPRSVHFFLYAPAALLGFMIYNLFLTGDPIAFVHTQQIWGREFGLPWPNFYNNILLILHTIPHTEPGILLDTVMVLFSLAALLFLTLNPSAKIRASYLVIGWIWLSIPLFSTSPAFPLYSLARFVLVIFPIYIFWAHMSQKYFTFYIIISSMLLVLCAALFMNWYWIG